MTGSKAFYGMCERKVITDEKPSAASFLHEWNRNKGPVVTRRKTLRPKNYETVK
jgi:hypothetical protein